MNICNRCGQTCERGGLSVDDVADILGEGVEDLCINVGGMWLRFLNPA